MYESQKVERSVTRARRRRQNICCPARRRSARDLLVVGTLLKPVINSGPFRVPHPGVGPEDATARHSCPGGGFCERPYLCWTSPRPPTKILIATPTSRIALRARINHKPTLYWFCERRRGHYYYVARVVCAYNLIRIRTIISLRALGAAAKTNRRPAPDAFPRHWRAFETYR